MPWSARESTANGIKSISGKIIFFTLCPITRSGLSILRDAEHYHSSQHSTLTFYSPPLRQKFSSLFSPDVEREVPGRSRRELRRQEDSPARELTRHQAVWGWGESDSTSFDNIASLLFLRMWLSYWCLSEAPRRYSWYRWCPLGWNVILWWKEERFIKSIQSPI